MSRAGWLGLGSVLVFGLACGGLGGGGGEEWDGETTFVCAGADKMVLSGQTVVLTEKDILAVEAAGNCELEIVDCDITADFALKAAGNAKVTVKGGRLHGRNQVIQAWGNAVVNIEGAAVEGEAVTTGNGVINGLGH